MLRFTCHCADLVLAAVAKGLEGVVRHRKDMGRDLLFVDSGAVQLGVGLTVQLRDGWTRVLVTT